MGRSSPATTSSTRSRPRSASTRSRPDPLGDYLASLERTAAFELRVAYPGHGEPVEGPAARAREIAGHHDRRLADTLAALDGGARSGFEVPVRSSVKN